MSQRPSNRTRQLSTGIAFLSILVALTLLSKIGNAGSSRPGDGGLSITFSDGGAGVTNITAAGTGVTDRDGANNKDLGFGNSDIDLREQSGVLPGLIPTVFDEFLAQNLELLYTADNPSATNFTGTLTYNRLRRIGNGSFVFNDLAFTAGISDSGTLSVVGGTFMTTVGVDFSTFAGAYGQSFASTDGWTFIFGVPIVAAPSAVIQGAPSNAPDPTILLVNSGAITSADTTGLNSIATTLNGVQNAAQHAVGDLNNRIFRARSGDSNNGSTASAVDSTSRYLNFAQTQNIDYRVALGLADGEEVEFVDTLSSGSGHPFALAGVPAVSKAVIVSAAGGSKNPVSDKVVIEEARDSQFLTYTSFDYGYYDQDNLTRTSRGFESDSYAGSAGWEYKVAPWLNLGGAFTYLENDVSSTAKLGTNDLNGQVYSIYATAFHGNTYLDVLYSYGDFDNDITRNTLLGRTAYGDTESHSHNVSLNLGHTIQATEKFSFGPSAGLNYTTGEVDGYTERNGGLANLIFPDHDFESTVGRLGGYATFKTDTAAGLLTTQASASWAHEFQPDGGNLSTSLETSPFALVTGNSFRSIGDYTASEERAHAGTDWLELGITSRLDIRNSGFHVELGYQGMFARDNATGHFGSAKIGYEW